MDETTATILLGCRLAKDLEENLQNNMANLQPEFLWQNCDEIIRVFSNVKDRISMSYPQMGFGNQLLHTSQQMEDTNKVQQEWLRDIPAPEMDLLQEQFFRGRMQQSEVVDVHGLIEQESSGVVREMVLQTSGGGGGGGGGSDVGRWLREHAVVAPATSQMSACGGRASSSSPRHRRRKNEGGRRRIIVAAPRVGNTEIPPEDGYTWRKYGQKDILKSKFPRSYFRCTHQKLYNCLAKKQVQRLDNDPTMFEVIYRDKHICHLSATAPSVPPPPPPPPPTSSKFRQDIIQHATTNIHPPPPFHYTAPNPSIITHSLSMGIMSSSSGQVTSSTAIDFSMQMGGEIGGAAVGGGGGVDDQLLEYMADTMFNSGSSSNNSMDLIFPSMENKRGSGERKN